MNPLNNEQIGVSAEVAIADCFDISVNSEYRQRGVINIINSITPIIADIFNSNNIPHPIKHIAEQQNVVDFILAENKTLSVKTNKQKLGKAAPQKIGQASSNTWFAALAERLDIAYIPTAYADKVKLFKDIALMRIEELLAVYWEYMFDCDFLIHIYGVVDSNDTPTNNPEYIVTKKASSPIWDKTKIAFTRPTISEWKESNTVKYECDGVAIGEFQVHNNRDNFKFRFNMAGIIKLMKENRLNFS
jgi:hypothetical protein